VEMVVVVDSTTTTISTTTTSTDTATGITTGPTDQPPTFGPGGQGQPTLLGDQLARLAPVQPAAPVESELFGLHYSVIYRNYEAQTLVNDIGRPLYALASGYEYFLFLEGRRAAPAAPAAVDRK